VYDDRILEIASLLWEDSRRSTVLARLQASALQVPNRGGREPREPAAFARGFRMPWPVLWAGYYPRRLGRRELMRDRSERDGCNVKNVDLGYKIDA